MTIQFSPTSNIPPNQRGELQLWMEKTVDKDTDLHLAAVSQVTGSYVMMRTNWHKSTHGSDKQEHLTGDVIIVRVKPIRTAALFDLISDRIINRWVRLTSTELDKSQCSALVKISRHSDVMYIYVKMRFVLFECSSVLKRTRLTSTQSLRLPGKKDWTQIRGPPPANST